MSIRKIIKSTALVLIFLKHSFVFCSEYKATNDTSKQNTSWSFGINVGAAFANKYQANFYNGSQLNENKISLIFDNYYYVHEIRNVLNDTFVIVGMPTDMKYKPAFAVGIYIKKNFTNNFGAFVQFNYSKFTAKDYFTLKLGSTPSSQAFPNLVNYPIWGSEDRVNIDIGASGEVPFEEKIFGFVEVGFNLNNTKVRENKIAIENLEYSLINIYGNQPFVPNVQLQEYPVRQGGIGLGAFAAPGIKFKFSEHVHVDVLSTLYWSKINLKHYDTFRLHYNFLLRFLFSSDFIKSY